jgi:enamine deaminase RidA (YjgF/YER057c/UK114 family)
MTSHITPVNPPSLMKPVGYSHAFEVKSGRVLFIAGQVAKDGDGKTVGAGDLVAQFRQVCENLRTVVTAAGGHLTDIVKLTIYVLDVDDYKTRGREIGAVYREYFGRHYPAMTFLEVQGLYDADRGCAIEIEAVAVLA